MTDAFAMAGQECSLECLNGGICTFGASSNGTGDMSNTGTNEAEMRCDCPKGYSGITCNTTTSGILCGPNKHSCLNGATCLLEVNPQTQVDRSYCDCSSVASLNRAYAGRFCQHEASVFCAIGIPLGAQQQLPRHSYCANGGRCKQIVQPDEAHQGCDCSIEWTGDHCQYPSGAFDSQYATSAQPIILEWALITILLISATVVVGYIITLLIVHRREEQKKALHLKERNRNLAAGAIDDINEAFNPYEADDKQGHNQHLSLNLLW